MRIYKIYQLRTTMHALHAKVYKCMYKKPIRKEISFEYSNNF